MMQHGYKYNRQGLLEEASMMHEAGFNVLITSVRSHDYNKGELITFGINEQQDLAAWYDLATNELPVNPSKIGMLGESLGGSMSIQYAVTNPSVRAVVLHSAFSSLQDTINTSVTYFTGLPAFPFAPMITFWAELILGFSVDQVDATRWISDFSPRPVLIIHSTTDLVISQKSGELLYQSASEPKTLWQESGIEHVGFDKARADDFSQKVGEFFTNALKPSFPKPGAAKSKWE
jgi:esterase/lipase